MTDDLLMLLARLFGRAGYVEPERVYASDPTMDAIDAGRAGALEQLFMREKMRQRYTAPFTLDLFDRYRDAMQHETRAMDRAPARKPQYQGRMTFD